MYDPQVAHTATIVLWVASGCVAAVGWALWRSVRAHEARNAEREQQRRAGGDTSAHAPL